jgi:hypothetical protein
VSEPRPTGRADRPVGSRSSDGPRSPGWREVLTVGAIVVGAVLGLAVLTSALPTTLQDVVFRTPLAIVVLVVGTVGLLIWLVRRPHPEA